MSDKNKKDSPYKKFAHKNATHTGFCSMRQLEPNKAYLMYDLIHTTKYGSGELAHLRTSKNVCWKVQLPTKYLKELDPEDIEHFKADIKKKAYPFVVFREVMNDGSFRMDMLEDSPDMRIKFKNWEDIPELVLEDSLNSSNEGPANKKSKVEENGDASSTEKPLNESGSSKDTSNQS